MILMVILPNIKFIYLYFEFFGFIIIITDNYGV